MMRNGNTTQVPNAAQVLERSYSTSDAVPLADPGLVHPLEVDQLDARDDAARPPVRRTQSAPVAPFCVPPPTVLSPTPAIKAAEKMVLVPPFEPSVEIQMLRPVDERDPELILLSPVHQRQNSAFHLAVRIHDFHAYCEGGETLTELIGVKEVFEGHAVNDQSVVFEEATIARAARSEVGIDEVRTVDIEIEGEGHVRWGYGTMRLGGELDVRTAMRYVPEAIRRTPVLARDHRLGHALVVLQLARQIAAQLVVAHEEVAHMDLKPDNVFVSPEGVARVGDWGTGRPLGGTPRDDGTHGYMPFEQYGHDSRITGGTSTPVHADAKSDMWSFGVLMLTALTGHNPFRAKYKLPCIRKLELYRAWERRRFTRHVGPLLTQERDDVLMREVFTGIHALHKEFPDFAPVITKLLRSEVSERLDAKAALDAVDALWKELGGDHVEWSSFWSTLSQLYRRHDPSAEAQSRSKAELACALHVVRDIYWAEMHGDGISS